MMDITELKTTQDSLARHSADLATSNAELQQFASAASHDLRSLCAWSPSTRSF